MSQPPRLPAELLDRYFAGQCTPNEVVHVQSVLALNPQLAMLQRGVQGEPVDVALAWSRFRSAVAVVDSGNQTLRGTRQKREGFSASTLRHWVAGAMAVMVLMAISVLTTLDRAPNGAVRMYRTAAGQLATITLSDGSRVTLAPQSMLTVAQGYGHAHRQMSLVGEAYFHVEQQTGIPLVVKTGIVSTRVIGTTFDVRRYNDESAVRVIVVAGKVSTAAQSRSPVVLVAGNVGVVSDSTISVTTVNDVTNDLSWRQGTLVFHDTPLVEVLNTLRRWYGVEFQMTDTSMMHWHVSGTLAGTSQAEALSALRVILNVDMTFSELPGHTPMITLVRQSETTKRGDKLRDRHNLSYPSAEVGR